MLGKAGEDDGEIVSYPVAIYERDGICWSVAPRTCVDMGTLRPRMTKRSNEPRSHKDSSGMGWCPQAGHERVAAIRVEPDGPQIRRAKSERARRLQWRERAKARRGTDSSA